MEIDLDSFGRFDFDTEALGTLTCAPLSDAVVSAVRKHFPDLPNADPALFAKFVLGAMCRPKSSATGEPALLTSDQLERLTTKDIDQFAERCVENNKWLFRDEENTPESPTAGPLTKDEDPKAQLRRGFNLYLQRREKMHQKLAELTQLRMPKSLLSDANLRLLGENAAISRDLGQSLSSLSLAQHKLDHLKSMRFDADGLSSTAQFRKLHEQMKSIGLDFGALGKQAQEWKKLQENMKALKLDWDLMAKQARGSARLQEQLDLVNRRSEEIAKALEPARQFQERLQEQSKRLEQAFERTQVRSPVADYERGTALQPPQLELPAIPANPILETNAKLELMVTHLESIAPVVTDSAALIKNMNDLGLGLVASSAEHAERTAAQNRTMIKWAIVGVFISALVGIGGAIYSYAKEDATATALREVAGRLASSQEALVALQRSSDARQVALEAELKSLRAKPTPKAKPKPPPQ